MGKNGMGKLTETKTNMSHSQNSLINAMKGSFRFQATFWAKATLGKGYFWERLLWAKATLGKGYFGQRLL